MNFITKEVATVPVWTTFRGQVSGNVYFVPGTLEELKDRKNSLSREDIPSLPRQNCFDGDGLEFHGFNPSCVSIIEEENFEVNTNTVIEFFINWYQHKASSWDDSGMSK